VVSNHAGIPAKFTPGTIISKTENPLLGKFPPEGFKSNQNNRLSVEPLTVPAVTGCTATTYLAVGQGDAVKLIKAEEDPKSVLPGIVVLLMLGVNKGCGPPLPDVIKPVVMFAVVEWVALGV
jgi:hypothetical protein